MTLHILDFIMYIVLVIVLWYAIDLISEGELTEELGCLIGLAIIAVFTIVYIIMFVFCGWDWTDIFSGNYESWLKLKL